jgi:hypothetical protein
MGNICALPYTLCCNLITCVRYGSYAYLAPLYAIYYLLDKIWTALSFCFSAELRIFRTTWTSCSLFSIFLENCCNQAYANVHDWWYGVRAKLPINEARHPIIQFIFDYVFAPIGELFTCTWKALYWWVLFSFLLILDYFLGAAMLMVGAMMVDMSDNVYVAVEGLKAMANFVLYIWSGITLGANIARPIYLVVAGAAMKMLTATISDLDVALGGSLNARSARALIDNPILQDPDMAWEWVERGITSYMIPLIDVLDVFIGFAVLLYRIVSFLIVDISVLLSGAVTNDITQGAPKTGSGRMLVEQIPPAASTVLCCLSNGQQFGCCAKKAFRAFVLSILMIDIGYCKPNELPGSTPCKCGILYGGPFDLTGECPIPQYRCDTAGDMFKETLEITVTLDRTKSKNIPTGEGPIREIACKNYIRQQGFKTARKLSVDTEDEPTCANYCFKSHIDEWFFDRCTTGDSYLVGRCNGRALEGELWQAHLDSFKKKHPRFSGQVQNTPLPKIEYDADKVDGRSFMDLIEEVERSPLSPRIKLDCGKNSFPDDFKGMVWRGACLSLRVIDNKIFPSGKIEGPRHLSDLLYTVQKKDGVTATEFLDNIGHSFNNYTNNPEYHVRTDYHARRLERQEHIESFVSGMRKLTEESKEKRRQMQAQLGDRAADQYPCPNGYQYVTDYQLNQCEPVVNFTAQATFRYAFYMLTSLEVNLDIVAYLNRELRCWRMYEVFPERDPTTINNIYKAITRTFSPEEKKNLKFCFPLVDHIPYSPTITWNWNTYVANYCAKPIGDTKSPCICQQYDQSKEIFDYHQPWTTVSSQASKSRYWNVWKVFQYLITRVELFSVILSMLTSIFWTIFAVFLPTDPVQRNEALYAFNTTFAEYGQSQSTNVFCMGMNMGFVYWFVTYNVVPGIIFFRYYAPTFIEWIKGGLGLLIYRPCHELFIRLTLRNYRAQLQERAEMNRYIPPDLVIQAAAEEREYDKKITQINTSLRHRFPETVNRVTSLMNPLHPAEEDA